MSFNTKKIYYVTDIIIKYLVFFSPLSFILGNFLLDLNMSLISVIFLFYIFKENSQKYFFNLYFKCFIVISIYFFINSILSTNPTLSLESSLFYARFVVFPLAIWYIIDLDKRNLKVISKIFISVYLFVIFDSFIQYFFNQNLFGFHYIINLESLLYFVFLILKKIKVKCKLWLGFRLNIC